MHRRHLLALLAGIPGCLGSRDSDKRTPTPLMTRRTTDRRTQTVKPTTTGKEYETFEPDPRSMDVASVEERLERHECGFAETNTKRCGEDSGNALSMATEPTIGKLPETEIALTIRNDTDQTFKMNPYGWELFKFDGGEWRRLAPLSVPAPLGRIESGKTHAYQLQAQTSFQGSAGYVSDYEIQIGGLGPGVYGFGVEGSFSDEPDETLVVGVPIGIAGSGPRVRPTDNVAVERDGPTLVVFDRSTDRKGSLTLELVDDGDAIQLLDEHLMQSIGLRNTVPFGATQGIEQIRFEGERQDVRAARDYLQMVGQGGLESQFTYRTVSFVVND